MQKKVTISLDEVVYDGLIRLAGRRRISKFIENLARPHVFGGQLDEGYRAMATDAPRERDAREWIDDLARDATDVARWSLVGGFRARRRRRDSQDAASRHRQQ